MPLFGRGICSRKVTLKAGAEQRAAVRINLPSGLFRVTSLASCLKPHQADHFVIVVGASAFSISRLLIRA